MASPAAAWELSKENVQPLKRGRRVDALGEQSGCGAPSASAEQQRL